MDNQDYYIYDRRVNGIRHGLNQKYHLVQDKDIESLLEPSCTFRPMYKDGLLHGTCKKFMRCPSDGAQFESVKFVNNKKHGVSWRYKPISSNLIIITAELWDNDELIDSAVDYKHDCEAQKMYDSMFFNYWDPIIHEQPF